MASRSQFEGFPPPKSTLQRFILNACDPISNYEPNLALNLEVVDLINSKKGNAPREAASTLVQLINHRNPNVSLLALGLLDICVKNCGYPFHLQISTKEFLNELVRRFPERPPIRPSRVQSKILEAIEEWRGTICQTSRYKEDLGFIRDMHRLLLYKGYMFPEVRREDAAVLNPSDVCWPIALHFVITVLTIAELTISRGDGSRRACRPVCETPRADTKRNSSGSARSQSPHEGHGWL
jgi:ADP-ribosylation factor-binding protein GGA